MSFSIINTLLDIFYIPFNLLVFVIGISLIVPPIRKALIKFKPNVEESFDINLYEILDERVHKYSSTSVSVSRNQVSSTRHFHSDQELWARNLKTGIEEHFEFSSFNINARPGHRLLCVNNKASGDWERLINLDTGSCSLGNGLFNTKKGHVKYINNLVKRIAYALFAAGMFSIVGVNILAAAIAIVPYMVIAGTGMVAKKGVKIPRSRFYGILIVYQTILTTSMVYGGYYTYTEFDIFYYFPLLMFILSLSHLNETFDYVKTNSDALDIYLEGYIPVVKKKLQNGEDLARGLSYDFNSFAQRAQIERTQQGINEAERARNAPKDIFTSKKFTTLLLTLFLGVVGAHKFYLKNYVQGFFRILALGASILIGYWSLLEENEDIFEVSLYLLAANFGLVLIDFLSYLFRSSDSFYNLYVARR